MADLFPIEPTPVTPADDEPVKILEYVQKHEADYQQIKANLDLDRLKADKVIGILMQKLETNTALKHDVESLVKALDVISNTNGRAVKLLDTRAKMIASIRGPMKNVFANVNAGGAGEGDLTKILSQPEDDI